MTDFISDNPALTAYFNTANNQRAQQEGDIQLRQAQQTEGANNAIDADLRQWFQKGSPQPAQASDPSQGAAVSPQIASPSPAGAPGDASAPSGPQVPAAAPSPASGPAPSSSGALANVGIDPPASTQSQIAQTPGTGRFLLGMNQAAYQRRQDMTYRMFDAMDKGDLPQAQYLAQTVGFNLPPAAWQDTRTIRTLGQAKYFQPMFQGDEQQFGKFLSDAMRGADANGGTPDWQGSLQRNAPRGAIAAKIDQATEAMGHRPSDQAIEAMAGGRMPYGTYGYGAPVPVTAPDGTTTYVQPSKSGAPARPVVGPDGKPLQAAARPSGQATQADRDWTAATNAVNQDPTYMGNKPEQIAARDAEIQRRYDAAQAGRARNNTSARPGITAPRVDQGVTQNGPAQAPAGRQAHAGTQQYPHTPQSQADFDAIPKGAIYMDPGNNQLYRKP